MTMRTIDGYLAVQVEMRLGWNHKLDAPNYVKRWCIDTGGSIAAFRNLKELEKGVYSLKRYGFIRTIESTPPVRSAKVKDGKLSIGLMEAVVGFCKLIDGEPRDKYRVPAHVRDLGYQRPMVC